MANEQSIAPKERVNITFKAATGDAKEQQELPLKILMVGDYDGRHDNTPLDDPSRKPISVDKENFNDVMTKRNLAVKMQVPDRLSGEKDASLTVDLKLRTLADFTPEGVAAQVPELQKLVELRAALSALKGPLGNFPTFKKRIQELLSDEAGRKKLMEELGLKG